MILGIFSAIWNWITGKSRQAEGRIQEKADALLEDPHAIDAIYRKAIEGDASAIEQLANAVGGLHARLASDEASLKQLISDKETGLEALKLDLEGTDALREKLYMELSGKGLSEADIAAHPKFAELTSFYEDTQSTVNEREARIAEIQERITTTTASLADRKAQLQSLHRALERKKIRREEAKADAVVSKQLENVAGVLAGINVDGHNAELQRAEEALARLKGRAKAKTELAGMDVVAQRAQVRAAAAKTRANEDFFSKMREKKGAAQPSVEPEVKANEAATEAPAGTGKSEPPPL